MTQYRWEYRIERESSQEYAAAILARLGADYWELVAVVVDPASPYRHNFYFKRPRRSDLDPEITIG